MSERKTQGGERVRPVDHESAAIEHSSVLPKGTTTFEAGQTSSAQGQGHGAVELVDTDSTDQPPIQTTVAELDRSKGRFGYFKKRQFWIVLLLSQALAITITGTNTLTTLLQDEGTSIPAFQTLFNVNAVCLRTY
jgi:solute carrier family 35 protein F1/2